VIARELLQWDGVGAWAVVKQTRPVDSRFVAAIDEFDRTLDAARDAGSDAASCASELAPIARRIVEESARLGEPEDLISLAFSPQLASRGIDVFEDGAREAGLILQESAVEVARAHDTGYPNARVMALAGLATALNEVGRHAEAEAAARDALDVHEAASGPLRLFGVAAAATARLALAQAAAARGDARSSEAALRRALEEATVGSGPASKGAVQARYQLVTLLERQRRLDESARLVAEDLPRVVAISDLAPGNRNLLAWTVVRVSGLAAVDYESALSLIEPAVAVAPEDAALLNTLGVALYRCGRDEEAIARLSASHERNSAPDGAGAQPADLAFLALAHRRIGNGEAAATWLGAFLKRMNKLGPDAGPENQGFFAEVETAFDA